MRNSGVPDHSVTVTYLITFSTYGSHLHGDPRGSVDPKNNQPGSRMLGPRPGLERNAMTQSPYLLDDRSRPLVLESIVRVCELCGWRLLAAHARSNHVHVVVDVECHPDTAAAGLQGVRQSIAASSSSRFARTEAVDPIFECAVVAKSSRARKGDSLRCGEARRGNGVVCRPPACTRSLKRRS